MDTGTLTLDSARADWACAYLRLEARSFEAKIKGDTGVHEGAPWWKLPPNNSFLQFTFYLRSPGSRIHRATGRIGRFPEKDEISPDPNQQKPIHKKIADPVIVMGVIEGKPVDGKKETLRAKGRRTGDCG